MSILHRHLSPPLRNSHPGIAFFFLLYLFTASIALAADQGKPVAMVNGVLLYQSDLYCAVEAALARQLTSNQYDDSEKSPDDPLQDNEATLRRLIVIELLYQESLKHRFNGILEESQERYRKEVKRLGGEEMLTSALLCNNMSTEQFRKAIFRNLSINRLLNEVVYSKIQISEEEARKYYDEHQERFRKPESVRVRQILIKASSKLNEEKWREAEKRAYMIYQDAATGIDFVRLARRHSEDPISASTGGDMGAIEKGNLNSTLDSQIFKMKAGTVIKPVRSRQGFHIFKIVSTIPSRIHSFEEVEQQITTMLRRERARSMILEFIADLESGAEIKILD